MAFDEAARAKALETRKRNALDRKLKAQNAVTGTATTELSVTAEPEKSFDPASFRSAKEGVFLEVFSWNDSPLGEAINRLSDLKREYDMAAQIIMQRQSREPVVYTCWSQGHKDSVARAALAQCKVTIRDGKWASRDDGAKDDEGKVSPAVCCSMLCYQSYSEYRSKAKSRIHIRQ